MNIPKLTETEILRLADEEEECITAGRPSLLREMGKAPGETSVQAVDTAGKMIAGETGTNFETTAWVGRKAS